MKNRIHTRKIVLSALLCAMVYIGTCIAIPTPLFGNVNFGDAILMIGGWLMGLPFGLFLCIGSALADLTMGYAVYIPATLVIKLLTVLSAVLLWRALSRLPVIWRSMIAAFASELFTVFGYYLFESVFLFDSFLAAAVNIPFNLLQATFATLLASVAARFLISKK